MKFFLLSVFPLACVCAVDAFFIEPDWIEITRHAIKGKVAAPLKIAHLSDLHVEAFGRRERRLLDILNTERPDLVVITGDAVGQGGNYRACGDVLRLVRAPLGVWLVRGNWENWRPVANDRAFYESSGVNFLLNESRLVRKDVRLVGFDDPYSGKPNPQTTLAGVSDETFNIGLFHAPGLFEETAGACPLFLAGHTHGGQVCVPFWGPLWLPPGCGRFLSGWYEKNGSRMYVSRGVGTSIYNVRFWCRPEVAFITVEN